MVWICRRDDKQHRPMLDGVRRPTVVGTRVGEGIGEQDLTAAWVPHGAGDG